MSGRMYKRCRTAQMHRIPVTDDIRKSRIKSLYREDANMMRRNSADNPDVNSVYREFYGRPMSELAEKLLHTHYGENNTDKQL